MRASIIVHGGAWNIPSALHKAHEEGMARALKEGQKKLAETDDAHRACLAVLTVLENEPVFDAGTGSFLNAGGEVEMDAGIMKGEDLSAGAVAALKNIRNPILVAEAVRVHTQHVLLAGQGAYDFAREQGFKRVETEALLTGREKERYRILKERGKVRIKSFFEKKPSDTVGAVVMDSHGRMTAGTTTGGTPHKMAGRVGDVPVPGSGFYADNRYGAVSVTGWGEGILRAGLAMRAMRALESGAGAAEAAGEALRFLEERIKGEAGIIVLDARGRAGFDFNTPYMAVGYATVDNMEYATVLGEGTSGSK